MRHLHMVLLFDSGANVALPLKRSFLLRSGASEFRPFPPLKLVRLKLL